MTAIIPSFGCKRTLAPRIVAELGKHDAYWELCCCSCAALFAKEPCRMETVVDLWGDVTHLIRCLQNDRVAVRLFRRASRTVMSDVLYREAFQRIDGSPPPADGVVDLDRAYDFLVYSWQGRNGTIGARTESTSYCVRYTNNGGHAATRWRRVAESIPWWNERLRDATVLQRDIFAVLPKIPDVKGTVIYIDPPYIEKGAKYIHDFTDTDHLQLCQAVRRFKRTRVVISYYDHPDVRTMYPGWTFVDCSTTKSLVSAGKRDQRGTTKAPEVLIINGPSLTQSGELFVG